ncbi:MAG: serine/threonine-protein phosphatase [Leptospiraceae bacterium]|nr:serine/threonine-protein phosphatase [Leptospiraceae bacterium]MCP5497451.1 serine/threonine-protein phosphatase [Leptospiraceae bacterium]
MNTKEKIQYLIQNNKLKFFQDIEILYYNDYYKKSLKTIRVALFLAFILYSFFGFLDTFLAPNSKTNIWLIRYGVVCPILIFAIIISYFKLFKKYMQLILSYIVVITGFGILAMISIIVEVESGMYYYAGLILVLMWGYTFVRLKFINASIVCWTILIAYQFVAIFFQKVTNSSQLTKIFISNNFFFVSANIIGMSVSYIMELSNRKDFLHRLLILEEQRITERERNELRLRNKIVEEELSMARKIQRQLIPNKSPKQFISFLYEPMEAVGGDLLDFLLFREKNRIGIFLSDVAGHGVPAALIASMVKTTLIQSGKHKENPAEFLMYLNDILINKTDNYFVTAFYGIYDSETKSITYSNAGHNPPYLISETEITFLESGKGLPLAVIDNKELNRLGKMYKNQTESIAGFIKLLLYTDGLVEARKVNSPKIWFYDEIEAVLFDLKYLSNKEFISQLYEKLILFQGNKNFEDDICVICMDI